MPKIKTTAQKILTRRGFSLIEMLVATALFSVVMIIAVGALLTVVDGNRKAQALKLAMDNLNFAVESMSRTMRVGTTYHCRVSSTVVPEVVFSSANDCPSSGGTFVAFESFEGDTTTGSDQFVYRYVFPPPDGPGRLERCLQNCGNAANYIPITAPEVNIEFFRFYVTGTGNKDQKQPRVVITIRGSTGAKARIKTSFSLQTMVSQRILDLEDQ